MKPHQFAFESMGTHWEVTVWDAISDRAFDQQMRDIVVEAEQFDATFSRFKKDSLIWKLAQSSGVMEVPEDLVAMLKMYEAVYEASDYAVNPLIGFTLSDLGYDDRYSLQSKSKIRRAPNFPETLKIIDERTIELVSPVLIDVGAVGKGFFVDRMFERLTKLGVEQVLVNGSGDVRYRGSESIRLGLEDPQDAKKVVGVFELREGAFAASGISRRAWGDVHHIVDARTSTTSDGLLASWVYASSAAWADLLATSLLLVSPDSLRSTEAFSYCLMNNQRKIKRSADFAAELF